MRLATIDIGTNTAQLLVAEADGTELHRLYAAEQFVRLGEGVDTHNRIGNAAQERLIDALRNYIRTANKYEVDQLSAVGTSALRDATNRDAVRAAVRDEVGTPVEILSGREEAKWSFAAACAAFDDLAGPCLVVDIGGGSTELIAGREPLPPHLWYPEAITDRASLDVGCVRLTDRCFPSLPPSPDAVEIAEQIIEEALVSNEVDVGGTPTVIGTAGTASALALVHAGPKSTWDALDGSGFSLTRAAVRRWRERLLRLSVDEIRTLHPDAMEGRADVFPVGVILLERILTHYNQDGLYVSPYELRHGLALRLLTSTSPSPL